MQMRRELPLSSHPYLEQEEDLDAPYILLAQNTAAGGVVTHASAARMGGCLRRFS